MGKNRRGVGWGEEGDLQSQGRAQPPGKLSHYRWRGTRSGIGRQRWAYSGRLYASSDPSSCSSPRIEGDEHGHDRYSTQRTIGEEEKRFGKSSHIQDLFLLQKNDGSDPLQRVRGAWREMRWERLLWKRKRRNLRKDEH